MVGLTEKNVAKSLINHRGNLAKAAESLGCSRRALYDCIEKWPELADIRQDAKEDTGDKIEYTLEDKALEGDLGAIKTWLASNRSAVYGDRRALELSGPGGAVAINVIVAKDGGD